MARADQGAVITGARLSAALAISLAVHAAGLAALEGMQHGWGTGVPAPSALRVTLRAEPRPPEPRVELKSIPAKAATRPAAAPKAAVESRHGLIPPPVYYGPNELDERPLILAHVEPRFPSSAAIEAKRVVLRLYIGELGNVDQISVMDGDPAGVFETAAAEAFAAARFRPGMRGGVAVRSLVTLELLFGEPVPADQLRASDSPPLANPNSHEAPDRAAVRQRAPRVRGGA